MAKRGVCALDFRDILEIRDLYRWGMQVWMICAFYDVHKRTLGTYLDEMVAQGMLEARRPSGQPKEKIKSSLPRSRVAVRLQADPFEDAYQLVREHARVLRDTHTGRRPADASIRSYRAAVSELRHVCERNGTRPRGPGSQSDIDPDRKGSPRCHRTVSAASLPPRAGAYRDRS